MLPTVGINRLHVTVDARNDQSTADQFGGAHHIAMCQSPAHLTVAANRPRLNLALHDHMPEAW